MPGRRKDSYIFATEYNRKPRHVLRHLLLVILAVFLLGFLANVVCDNSLVYERVPVTVPNLPEALEQFSILHLSDLHGRRGLGGAIRRALGSRVYSCAVMTGNMLGPGGDTEGVIEVLHALPAGLPVYLIPGDEDPDYLDVYAHEGLTAYADWAEKLIGEGVTILDEPVLMTRGKKNEARIWFVPEELYTQNLDSVQTTYEGVLSRLPQGTLSEDQAAQKRVAAYQIERVRHIREAVRSMQAGDIQVAVAHTPITDAFSETLVSWTNKTDVFSIRQVSLILAGHYCAGQWRVPGRGPLYVPGFGFFPSDEGISGQNYVGRILQYISPGLGASGAYPYQPFRLFNPPVISSLELTQKYN